MSEKHLFQTEVRELLNLVIHSLYSNRDIFLRELIANANDAIDKCRFAALTDPNLNQGWQIRIASDTDAKTMTITDNGIGMSHDELINHLGTIAKSGTKAFLEQLKSAESPTATPDLIGQFGVGFYSSFMVAERVEVVTRKAGEDAAYRWISTGDGHYEIETALREQAGTDIILHMREDALDYLTEWRIREIVKKYADFVEHPIVMLVSKKKDDVDVTEDEILNSQKAIWRRPSSEVTPEEYENFYTHLDHFGEKPLKSIHFSTEGTSSFTALLYIPQKAPFDFFYPDSRQHGLQLYVRRVFITDSCKELIPEYLRFVRGVVESNDLPLNVSREILQDNPHIRSISKAVVRKVLAELQTLQDNSRTEYESFWQSFSRPLKEGLRSDYLNNDKIKTLLMFETLNGNAGKMVTLKEYVAAMPESQTHILYFIGESRAQIEASPLIERAKAQGWDVLLMTDTIDEWIAGDLGTYQEKSFKALSKGDAELTDDEKKMETEKSKEFEPLTEAVKKVLGDRVKTVSVTARLTESPACLIRESHESSAQLERFLRAMNQPVPEVKPALQLNPEHLLVKKLLTLAGDPAAESKFADYAFLILDQATLAEGSPLTDPVQFSRRLSALMTDTLA